MKDKLLKLDYYTGLIRGWGLILYATLPSGLALLNVLEIKTSESPFHPVQLLFPIIPLIVLYVLIRNKQKKWFLKRKYLNRRTIFSLGLILILTTSICGISLLITKNYQISFTWEGLKGVWQAFLMSVSSLVISATLFLTILTKNDDLPGVPNNKLIETNIKFTERFNKIRIQLIEQENNNNSNSIDKFLKEIISTDLTFITELRNAYLWHISDFCKEEYDLTLKFLKSIDIKSEEVSRIAHNKSKLDSFNNLVEKINKELVKY